MASSSAAQQFHTGQASHSNPSDDMHDGGNGQSPFAGGNHPLDDMLYNVYLKTASLITHTRLTHWHDIDTFNNLQETYPSSSQSTHASQQLDTNFSLALPPLAVFTEELSTWRHMSAFAPAASLRESAERPLDEQVAKPQMYVPPMILDVILDPAKLLEDKEHALTLVKEHQDSPSTSRFIPVESLAQEDNISTAPSTQRPVILERWRIDFVPFPPENPPEEHALYQEIAKHFADFARLARRLPAQKLYQRLRTARIAAESQTTATRPSQYNQYDDLLQIGCRLGAGEPSVQTTSTEAGNDNQDDTDDEIGLKVKLSLSRQSSTAETGDETEMETSIYGFSPIITPMGSINVSVEYRNSIDFQVKHTFDIDDRSVPMGIASAELKPDEDFFRPKPSPTPSQDIPPSLPTSSVAGSSRKLSALSALRQHSSSSGSSSPIPQVPSNATAASSGASSPAPSLFSVSAPGRPVAGLSSLRSQGAVPIAPTTDLTIASGSTTSAISGSPGVGEPAFITHNRRPSMSERRFRTLSGLGSDRPSPPSPMGSAGPAVRPTMPSQMRFGSYSPSSPSPLAQQLSGSQAQAQAGASSSSLAGTSSPALPSHRSESAPKLSLRSIFSDYGPRVPGSRSSIPSPSALRTTFHATSQRPIMNRTPSGGDERDTNVATSSNASAALPGSSSSTTSSTSRHTPSVAPQMIQRYARTPSYRQERRMTGGSIGESEGEHTGMNRGGGGSSVEGGGTAGSGSGSGGASGSYSRSWQARTEARQAMIANAMQRGSLGSGASGSPSSVHGRGSPPVFGSVTHPQFLAGQRRQSGQLTSSSSPSAASSRRINRKGSIDEFVAMLESRPQLNSPLSGKRPSPTPTQPPPRTSGDSEPAFRIHPQPSTSSAGSFTRRESELGRASTSAASGAIQQARTSSSVSPETSSPSLSGAGGPSRALLSRSAVDEMLAKMSLTVSRLASQSTRPQSTSTAGSTQALSRDPASQTVSTEPSSRPVATTRSSARQTRIPVEGGRGARVYEQGTGEGDSSASRNARQGSEGLLSTGDASSLTDVGPRRLTSRSQSSFELSSPDHPHLTLNQRTSSGYDENEADTALLGNYDEEEPAGRLELHSEPSTPHPGGSRPYGGYLSDAPSVGRRQGSDGNESGQGGAAVNTATISGHETTRADDVQIEGGFGSLAADPSDAERLRSFGEELGSTRGRRNQSPWEIRRAATPGNSISNATSPVGSAGHNGGNGWSGTPYGAFAMRPSHSNPRPLRGASGRGLVYPGGHHFNGDRGQQAAAAAGYHQAIRGQRRSRSGSATATPAVGSPNPTMNATPESPRQEASGHVEQSTHDGDDEDDESDDAVASARPTAMPARGTAYGSQTLNRDW
ncbi:unnamed protein product [Sympodiomycopsis kandeliae]